MSICLASRGDIYLELLPYGRFSSRENFSGANTLMEERG